MIDRRHFLGSTAALALAATAVPLHAGRAPVYAENGVAIRGADPVAYFLGHGAVAGSTQQRVRWRGAWWLFARRENREAFEFDPHRFAPRFGGYCAYTMSQGGLSPTDPHAFHIHDDRLYLVRSTAIKGLWMRELAYNIKMAERHWPHALG